MFDTTQKTESGVAYYSRGDSNDVVLLVHGSFGTAQMWGPYVAPLESAGYRVVALDLAGHGQSDGDLSKIDMDGYVQNIKDVIAAEGIDPIVIGHSMSGLVVLMAGVAGLATKLIAIDPSPSLELQGMKPTDGIPDEFSAFDVGMPADRDEMIKAHPDIAPETLAALGKTFGNESGPARRQRKAGVSIPKDELDRLDVMFIAAENGASVPFGIKPASTMAMGDYYERHVRIVPGATHLGIVVGSHATVAVTSIIEFLS